MKLPLIVLFSFCLFNSLSLAGGHPLAPSIFVATILDATVTVIQPAIIGTAGYIAGYTATNAASNAAIATGHTNVATNLTKLAPAFGTAFACGTFAAFYNFSPTNIATTVILATIASLPSPNANSTLKHNKSA